MDLLFDLKNLLRLTLMSVLSSLCLSWLLMNHLTDRLILNVIIEIVLESVSKPCHRHGDYLNLLRLPLVVLLSQSPSVGGWKSVITKAMRVLELINKPTDESITDAMGTPSCVPPSHFLLSSRYTSLSILAVEYVEFTTTKSMGLDVIINGHDDTTSLAIVLCALHPIDLSNALPLVPDALINDMGFAFIAYVLYMLTQSIDVETCFCLLQSLSCFCTNPINTELVMNVLISFTKTTDMFSLALRLISKSWEKNDKIFDSMTGLLAPQTNIFSNSEWFISAAATLKDIAYIRPYQRGEDSLPYIYQLLSSTSNPLVFCLLVEALVGLCINEVADPSVLWKLLSSKLPLGQYPAVDVVLCEFFASAPSNTSNETFLNEALKILWKFTLKSNLKVFNASLIAITKFDIDLHTHGVLPDPLLSLITQAEDPAAIINSNDFLSIVLSLTRERQVKGALCEVVKYLIREDLNRIPRGAVYSALQKLKNLEMSKMEKEIKQYMLSCQSSKGESSIIYLLISWSDVERDLDQFCTTADKLMKNEFQNDLFCFTESLLWHHFMINMVQTQLNVLCPKLPLQKHQQQLMIKRAIDGVFKSLKQSMIDGNVCQSVKCMVGGACAELHWDGVVMPLNLKYFIKCASLILKDELFHIKYIDDSSLSQIIKSLLTSNGRDYLLKPLLLSIPSMIHCLSQYSWKFIELQEEMKDLTFALIHNLRSNISGDMHHLTSNALSSILLEVPAYIDEHIAVFLQDHVTSSQSCSLLLVASLHDRNQSLDTLMVLLNNLETKQMTGRLLEDSCIDLANIIPVMYATCRIDVAVAMKVIQIFADLATTDRNSYVFCWCLGVVLHDLYMMSGHVSFMELMESLAVRWIQDGQRDVTDNHEMMSPLMGVAGLLGFSSVNNKIKGYTNVSFVKLLLSAGMPLLYQCGRSTDDHVRNTALWMLNNVYRDLMKHVQDCELVPSDLKYLSETSSLPSLFTQLQFHSSYSKASILTNEQYNDIIDGMAGGEDPLPVVNWESILIPLVTKKMHQRSVIKFINNQATSNIDGVKFVIQFMSYPSILHSLEEGSSIREFLTGLHSLLDCLNTSQIFNVFYYFLGSIRNASSPPGLLLTIIESLLSLLTSTKCSSQLNPALSIVIQLVCKVTGQFMSSTDHCDLFQPENSFILTLTQCLNITNNNNNTSYSDGVALKHLILCCRINIGDDSVKSLISLMYHYLSSSTLTTLETTWLHHTIRNICNATSKQHSYNQTFILTNLQEWTANNQANNTQLNQILRLLMDVLGVKPVDIQVDDDRTINWFTVIDGLGDTVKNKICEVCVTWLACDDGSFHSAIQGLLCTLRHSACFNKEILWTSTVQLLK
jgi:hypothetical protein